MSDTYYWKFKFWTLKTGIDIGCGYTDKIRCNPKMTFYVHRMKMTDMPVVFQVTGKN